MKTAIEFKGVSIDITYDYQPEEKESWGYHGGHPHIPASVEIEEAFINGVDVMELIEDYTEEIETLILNQ